MFSVRTRGSVRRRSAAYAETLRARARTPPPGRTSPCRPLIAHPSVPHELKLRRVFLSGPNRAGVATPPSCGGGPASGSAFAPLTTFWTLGLPRGGPTTWLLEGVNFPATPSSRVRLGLTAFIRRQTPCRAGPSVLRITTHSCTLQTRQPGPHQLTMPMRGQGFLKGILQRHCRPFAAALPFLLPPGASGGRFRRCGDGPD